MSDDEKLQELKKKLSDISENKEKQARKEQESNNNDASNMGVAFRACTELVLSIGVCGALGYGVDKYMNFAPLGMITGLLLGMAVGFMGIYRITNNMDMAVGYKPYRNNNKKSASRSDSVSTSKTDNDK